MDEGHGAVFVAGSGLDAGGVFRLSFAASDDGGETWDRTERLAVPPSEGEHHQLVPSISIAPGGRIDIVYYDLEEPSGLEDTFVVSSQDGGQSFSDPIQISDTASDTSIRGSSSFGNDPFSSGSMVVSTEAMSLVAWTDSRRGTTATAKRDIFFAAVEIDGN